jgi:hypothetical protein
MAINQVQFQRGLSMAEFMHRFGSDEACEATLIETPAAMSFHRACKCRARRCVYRLCLRVG